MASTRHIKLNAFLYNEISNSSRINEDYEDKFILARNKFRKTKPNLPGY